MSANKNLKNVKEMYSYVKSLHFHSENTLDDFWSQRGKVASNNGQLGLSVENEHNQNIITLATEELSTLLGVRQNKGLVRELVILGAYKFVFDENTDGLAMFVLRQGNWVEVSHVEESTKKKDVFYNVYPLDWVVFGDSEQRASVDSFMIMNGRTSISRFFIDHCLMTYFNVDVNSSILREINTDDFNGRSVYSYQAVFDDESKKNHNNFLKKYRLLKNMVLNDVINKGGEHGAIDVKNNELEGLLEASFTWLFGDDWLRLYKYKHKALNLKKIRDFIFRFKAVKSRLLAWESYNKNMAMLIVRSDCTDNQINDDNLFSYSNLLSDESPFFKFNTKAHVRNFMKLDHSIAELFYLKHLSIYDEKSYKGILFYKEDAYSIVDEVMVKWGVASLWIEHSKELVNHGVKQNIISQLAKKFDAFKDLYKSVEGVRLSYFFDLIYVAACAREDETQPKENSGHVDFDWLTRKLSDTLNLHSFNSLFDFATNRNARNTDWNVNTIDSKTTMTSLRKKEEKWHEELQQVDFERLMEDPRSLIEYQLAPHLGQISTEYEHKGYRLIPIKSNRELMIEGREMNHCIYSYDEELQFGEMFAFSVRGESERATVSFTLTKGRGRTCLDVSECSGYGNSTVSDDLEQAMESFADMLTENLKD